MGRASPMSLRKSWSRGQEKTQAPPRPTVGFYLRLSALTDEQVVAWVGGRAGVGRWAL